MPNKQSKAAEAVAYDILDQVSNGKIPNIYEIQRKHGYSHHTARAYKAIKTTTAKKVMNSAAEQMEKERNRILNELNTRDLSEERYEHLTRALDLLTKNHQLLTGGDTERNNVTFVVAPEIAEKNNIQENEE